VALLGRFPALAGTTLDVRRGEIVLVRGPNGAGKSTLLRVCAGLVPIAEGEASVLGHDLRADRRSLRSQVGLLGHANQLYAELTVAENVRFWARTVGASQAEVDAALEGLGLAGRLAGVAVARLSAGQRRRTALAALVARRPELWLLDEPHAGLDAEGRDRIDDLIHRAARSGATVVLASHDHDRVEALAGRTVHLVGGRVVNPDEPAAAGLPTGDAQVVDPATVEPALGVTC
jgi:heme ABC exporter ATP-binding subunit CcmA